MYVENNKSGTRKSYKSDSTNKGESSLDQLFTKASLCHFKKGQMMIFEDFPAFGVFYIKSGKAKVFCTGDANKETVIQIVTSGDLLGLASSLMGDHYTKSAVTLCDVEAYYIERTKFLEELKISPSINYECLKYLARNLHLSINKNISYNCCSVRERLAKLLLQLKDTGGGDKGRPIIDTPLTRSEMSSMIGVAHETLIRFIKEFKNDGLIEQRGKNIYILNEPELKKRAELDKYRKETDWFV